MVTNSPTYVRQPFPFSSIAADFTLKQNQILVEMLDVIRDKVEEFFRRGAADKMLFRAEDFDENGMAHIDVPLSSITPHPYEYNDIEEVATKILSAHMVYDDTDGKHIMNAFTEIVLPRTNGRRQGIVRFSFSKLQANKLFDFTRYSKFLKSVARNAKSSYTSTVYRDIEFHRFRGEWIADYKTLRQHLGCDIYDEKTKEWTVNKYGLYKNFKFRLLDVARKELKELADQGQVDCYFDYEEIYAGKVSLRHDPEKIRFIIHTTAMGELEDQKNKSQLRYIALEQFLQDEFSLTSADVQSIVRLVTDDIYEQFDIRVKEIAKSVKRQGTKIANVRLYAIKSLNAAIAEFTPLAQEIPQSSSLTPHPSTLTPKSAWIKVLDLMRQEKRISQNDWMDMHIDRIEEGRVVMLVKPRILDNLGTTKKQYIESCIINFLGIHTIEWTEEY